MLAENSARRVVLSLQNVLASSNENNTPPMGAPNAAAIPAAAPADMKSERSRSD